MHPEKDKLENAMFFVKALPLSPVMNVSNFIFDRLMIFNFYGTIFYFSLAGSNTRSIFFADRLLCGVLLFVPFISFFRNLLKREQRREKLPWPVT
jgi:hypothetical protein